MARSRNRIRIWYFSFIGYFMSLLSFVMIFTGGTTSRTGAHLRIDPAPAAVISGLFFIAGTFFLILSIFFYFYRRMSRSDQNRWRGR